MVLICDRKYKNAWKLFSRLRFRYFNDVESTIIKVKGNRMRIRTNLYGKGYVLEIRVAKNQDNNDWLGDILIFSEGEWWDAKFHFLTVHGLCSHLAYLSKNGHINVDYLGVRNCVIKRHDDSKLAEKLGIDTNMVIEARESDWLEYKSKTIDKNKENCYA